MEYKDVCKIFCELYFANRNEEKRHFDKFCECVHKDKSSTAKYHQNKSEAYRNKNESLAEFFERIKELAEESGENIDM